MPYYAWQGVELTGTIKKGKLFARNQDHLDQLLFKREIALLKCKAARQWWQRPIFLSQKADFFNRFSVLIDAGVRIPQALALVADQLDHPQLQEIIHDCARRVNDGLSLHEAMHYYPHVFSLIMIQMINAGEESGSLAYALEGICQHLSAAQDFYSRLRAALMLPIITILFFLAIMAIIFTIIMPRFVEIFSSFNTDLPVLTKRMLAISEFMLSSKMVMLLIIIFIAGWGLWRVSRHGRIRYCKEYIMLRIPLVGTIIQQRFLAYSLQSIAMMIEGGIPLVHAVGLVKQATDHEIFAYQLACLEYDVKAGSSLSDAMARHPEEIFSPESIAMVMVAEESGRLGPLLKKTAIAYHNQVIRTLITLTMILQPFIMLLLGFFVALLVYAVYGPIMNISSAF